MKPETKTVTVEEVKIGRIEASYQELGHTVEMYFGQNVMTLWETLATGETGNGRSFTVGAGGGLIWVTFDGPDKLKGSLSKICIKLDDFVRSAEASAEFHELFQSNATQKK